MFVLYDIRSTLSAIRDKCIILHHKRLFLKHFGVLMTNTAPFCASLRRIRTVFSRPKTCLPHEIAQCYLFGLISASKNLCNLLLKICAICGKNQRNLRLINDLRACKLLYNCREDSTTIESSLQNKLFMQNKANFRKVKLNVTNLLTREYIQMDTWSIRKTKPIQTQKNPIS